VAGNPEPQKDQPDEQYEDDVEDEVREYRHWWTGVLRNWYKMVHEKWLFPIIPTATSIRLLMTRCMTDRREQRMKREKIPTVSVMEHGSAKCLRSLFPSIS